MNQYSPYQNEVRFARPRITWAVQRLILLNVAVFAAQLLINPVVAHFFGGVPHVAAPPGGIVGGYLSFSSAAFLRGFVWTPLTYQFLHSGLHHLFMNMLWLFFFGPEVERVLGTRQFFGFYVFCGAAGVLANLLPYFLQGASPLVMGASGAAMGALVAFVMLQPDRQFFLFPLPVPITARTLLIIVVVFNVIISLQPGSAISWITHFGGMGAGYAYMKLAPKVNTWRRKRRLARKPKAPPSDPPGDKVGEAVDNIFKYQDRGRR